MFLKDARKKERYSQEAVAKILKVSTPTYVKWERNPELISIENARKLADVLHIDESLFFTEKH